MANLETIGRSIVQEAPQTYIDVDIEADGIAGMGSILSIGAVSPWGDEYYQELQPLYAHWIAGNQEFCEQHGLQRDRLQTEGKDPLETITDFATWTNNIVQERGKTSAVFSAFNASYNFPFIDLYTKEAGINNPYGVAGFCIKSLAMAAGASRELWDWKQTTKSRLLAELVPSGDFTHNALEDARYQQKIHFRLAGLLSLHDVL